MRPFAYERPETEAEAWAGAPGHYLAGGTTLLDLMKLDVMQPERLIDLGGIAGRMRRIERHGDALWLGALVTMTEAAAHPLLRRNYPVLTQSLELAASPQLRNMATLGGNVLQRTRCNYFREPSWSACNKRAPGSGCAALDGVNRKHAVLGTSPHCIAAYPGDLAQALLVLEARVEIAGRRGSRTLDFEDLHRLPGERPAIETVLEPDELIVGFAFPMQPWARRSLYLKIRDRESYEFALAAAAVALELDRDVARTARIALGGVATKPWRAHEAEAALLGQPLDEGLAQRAAAMAFAEAQSHGENGFKIELGQRTLVRALLEASRLSI